MSTQSINQVIAQMRVLAAQAQGDVEQTSASTTNAATFQNMLKTAVNNVNEVQAQSGKLQTAFEQGDPDVSIAQVMVSSQKAGIAFQGLLQVRNKLIQSYHDIMNMPI